MNVVITGASKGIGKAIAEEFAKVGYTLFLCARNETVLTKTTKELLNIYPNIKIEFIAIDLSIKEEAKRFGNWVLQKCVPDILINNAGHFLPGNTYNEVDNVLEDQLNTNLMSAYHLSRIIVPKMIEAKQGHVFNICSVASLQAYTGGGSYSISKFALDGFTKNLREEVKSFNIKVTGVYPGAVFTDSWKGFDNSQQRIMEANDIAKMVYAASQLSAAACVEEILIRPTQGDL